MSSDNASPNDLIAEMDSIIRAQYLDIMKKRIELSKKRAAKAPDVDDLQIVIDQMQADFDGITKTHASFMRTQKGQKGQTSAGETNPEAEQDFRKMLQEWKSTTMGSIVTQIPKQ